MADITKIQIGGTDYDIKDDALTTTVETMSETLANVTDTDGVVTSDLVTQVVANTADIAALQKDREDVYTITGSGYYYNLSVGVGETAALVSQSVWQYSLISAEEGDVYYITTFGGNTPKAWAFVDENMTILSMTSTTSGAVDSEEAAAPSGTAYLLVNSLVSSEENYVEPHAYKVTGGILYTTDIVNNLSSGGAAVPLSAEMGKELFGKLNNIVKELKAPDSTTEGYYVLATDGTLVENSTWDTFSLNVSEYAGGYLTCTICKVASTAVGIAFYDSSDTYISGYYENSGSSSITYGDVEVEIPSNAVTAKWCYANNHDSVPESLGYAYLALLDKYARVAEISAGKEAIFMPTNTQGYYVLADGTIGESEYWQLYELDVTGLSGFVLICDVAFLASSDSGLVYKDAFGNVLDGGYVSQGTGTYVADCETVIPTNAVSAIWCYQVDGVSAVPDSSKVAKIREYIESDNIAYDDTDSGLGDNVQTAIDTLNDKIELFREGSVTKINKPRMAYVDITTDTIPTAKTDSYTGVMTFRADGIYFQKDIEALGCQGNTSMLMPKKNFKFDFSDGKIQFGDWVAQDSFHLKAYYTDPLRCRNNVAVDLMMNIYDSYPYNEARPWRRTWDVTDKYTTATGEMDKDINPNARGLVDGFPIALYFNGEFYGLYVWNLKKHRDNYCLHKSVATEVHLDGDGYASVFSSGSMDWSIEIRNPKNLILTDGTDYDGDNPAEITGDSSVDATSAEVKGYVERFAACCTTLASSTTTTTFEEYFDPEWMIDYMLFNLSGNNSDSVDKNTQWVTYDGAIWYPMLYDCDQFGGVNWDGAIKNTFVDVFGSYFTSPWNYLQTLYADEIAARWAELRDAKLIDADTYMERFRYWVSAWGQEYLELEKEAWSSTPGYGGTGYTGSMTGWYESMSRVYAYFKYYIDLYDTTYGYTAS